MVQNRIGAMRIVTGAASAFSETKRLEPPAVEGKSIAA